MRVAALFIGIMAGITGSLVASVEPAMAAGPAAPATQTAPTASSNWRATVRDFAAEHFKNPAWGYSHSMRDYALARELAASDHVTLDDDVLFAAAYLHDMAAFKPWENEKLDHSDVAAGIVDTVLKGTGFPMAKIDAVRG
ncbi:MAG TPA: HD domain-containing protein, partial [Steroidobacteraceae bacterium]